MDILSARVLLRPRDLDTSLRFYEGVLGLHRFREWGERPYRGVVLFLGGGYLELTEGGPSDERGTAGVRLWLQVPDLHRVENDLRSAGVDLQSRARRQPWGLIEATIIDPDGLPIVLVEVPDDHPLRRDTR